MNIFMKATLPSIRLSFLNVSNIVKMRLTKFAMPSQAPIMRRRSNFASLTQSTLWI